MFVENLMGDRKTEREVKQFRLHLIFLTLKKGSFAKAIHAIRFQESDSWSRKLDVKLDRFEG